MNSLLIKKLLKSYKCFQGVYSSDNLPYNVKLPLNIIVNTDPSYKPGQHWVALSIDKNGRGYYFDSFGLPPLVDDIYKFITRISISGWNYNKKQIQNVTTSTCGNYCVLFTIFKCNNLSHLDFLSNFSQNTLKNDLKMMKIFKNFSLVKRFSNE